MGYYQGGGFGQNYSNRRTNYNQDFSQNRRGNAGYNYQARIKKHSGAKESMIKIGENKGKSCITAWNYSKRFGLRTFLVTSYKNSKFITSKKGREWQTMMVTIKSSGQIPQIASAFLDVMTNKVYIPDMKMVINPKAPNGGYCGTFERRK